MANMLSSEETAPSSTPQREHAVFSDEARRASSPPSSPPGFPWEQRNSHTNEPQQPPRTVQTAFSVLGKRKALADIGENARPTKRSASLSNKTDSKPLAQMQISLGQEVQKKCKVCGMEYVASAEEDRKLHDKYHKQNTEGYDVGKDFVLKTPAPKLLKGIKAGDQICAVDCFDTPARKRRGQAALEIVQRELGAVPSPENEIWNGKETCNDVSTGPKYQAYMYIRGTKCVGFLLAQRISGAHRVLEADSVKAKPAASKAQSGGSALSVLKARKQAAEDAAKEAAAQPIQLSNETYSATTGISRIWTSPTHRHQNIAMSLLDCAMKHHSQHLASNKSAASDKRTQAQLGALKSETTASIESGPPEIMRDKDNVAFSQPTEAGARLARRWHGVLYGWKVYVD